MSELRLEMSQFLTYCISLAIRCFSFQNNQNNLDPSYKMDLVFWGLFRKGKTHMITKFHETDLLICSHSRMGKPHLLAEEIWLQH